MRRTAQASLLLLSLLAWPALVQGAISWKSVTKPYSGVELRKGRMGSANVYVVKASLCTNRLHLAATAPPSSSKTPGSWGSGVGVQVAVNGDFFRWVNGKIGIYGDAVGSGKHWPQSQLGSYDPSLWAYRKNGWIAFGPDWVEFSNSKLVKQNAQGNYGWYPGKVTVDLPPGTLGLVSGFPQLVIDGAAVTCSSPTASSCFPDRSDMRQRHPRTAMGLTKDRRTLILAVVDGRSTSSIGMYGTELAALMKQVGAWNAFNLDGGGSSAMWVSGQGYVNHPSDGSARSVGNHFGIFAGSAGGKSTTPGSCFVEGGCFPTRVVGAESSAFKDFPTGWSGYAQAKVLLDNKITSGCKTSPDRMFCPKCTITRRQLMAFVVRAAGISTANPPATPTFSDVPKTAADYALIEAGVKAGITKGCNSAGTKFCPDGAVTRDVAAVFIQRAAGFKLQNPAKPTFPDVATDYKFYKQIETLKAACVASGYSDGTFRPDVELPRRSAAIWVVKAFNLDGKNSCLKETCNGKDDDLDGTVDEGCTPDAGPAPSADAAAPPAGDGGVGPTTDGPGVAGDGGSLADGGGQPQVDLSPAQDAAQGGPAADPTTLGGGCALSSGPRSARPVALLLLLAWGMLILRRRRRRR